MSKAPGSIQIRRMLPTDVARVQVVRRSVRENCLSNPGRITDGDVIAHMAELGQGWVSEIDTNDTPVITGFAMGRRDGNIWALFIDPAFEGLGHASALHDTMVNWLFDQGLQTLWLGTEKGTRAQRFYAQRGWQLDPPHEPPEVRMVMNRPKLSE